MATLPLGDALRRARERVVPVLLHALQLPRLTWRNPRLLRLGVGGRDRVPVDLEDAGEGPRPGEALAGAEPPGADVLARAVGDEMSKALGQPVIVENRAGAGGNNGADVVAKSTPDGYTLLMSSAGILTANPFLYSNMPFDAETAFIPVSNVAEMPMILVVNPKVPAQDLKELVVLAKSQPNKLNFGSPGLSTSIHLSTELFKSMAGMLTKLLCTSARRFDLIKSAYSSLHYSMTPSSRSVPNTLSRRCS